MSTTAAVLVALVKALVAFALVMGVAPLLIWADRKVSAWIQDRPGPNRASLGGIRAGGLVHAISDAIKLVAKEDIVPAHVHHRLWTLAPMISVFTALSTFIVIPWGDRFQVGDLVVPLVGSGIDAGALYILSITSLGVYGILLAGWSSNNKYALMGGLRASAQMVSYELAMGLSLVVMFLHFGTTRLDLIAQAQSGPIWNWGIFAGLPLDFLGIHASIPLTGVLAFVIFWTTVFAECNRAPFDLPEAEAELVAGYHTEYSGMRFAMFMLAEYVNMVVGSAFTATLFFGGYTIPFVSGDFLRAHADGVLAVLGLGAGLVVFPLFAYKAWSRRKSPFYQVLPAGDPRLKEPRFWTGFWLVIALVHLGLGALGLTGAVGATALGPEIVTLVLHLTMLLIKVLIGCGIMVWVRWTLPRFRYDQLMDLGWKRLLPLSMGNVLLAALLMVVFT